MDTADLRQLAAEREARQRAAGTSSNSSRADAGSGRAARAPSHTGKPAYARPAYTSSGTSLARAHRSIRFAHSLGLIISSLALGLLFLPWATRTRLWLGLAFAGGAFLARSGGAVIHGCLPPQLMEGTAPSPADVQAHDKSLFTPRLTTAALAEEWEVLLENLAFVCTYGKRNCLTRQMYTGPMTLGKICSLVWAKLQEGVIRC